MKSKYMYISIDCKCNVSMKINVSTVRWKCSNVNVLERFWALITCRHQRRLHVETKDVIIKCSGHEMQVIIRRYVWRPFIHWPARRAVEWRPEDQQPRGNMCGPPFYFVTLSRVHHFQPPALFIIHLLESCPPRKYSAQPRFCLPLSVGCANISEK